MNSGGGLLTEISQQENKKTKCIACKKPAIVNIMNPFCKECFIKHYERRVENLIKRHKLVRKGDKILVAVSGGKDSLSCANVLSKLREKFDFELGVLHIDVGIPECTNERTLNVVEGFCRERDITFHFYDLSGFLGGTTAEVAKVTRRPLCSLCGMLKRYVFNRFARENGYNKIATGHCADDVTRFFFKNWISRDFLWISKLKPITVSDHPKVVTRIRPLYEMLEAENLAYIQIQQIPIAGCSRCSYFLRRDKWFDILRLIDEHKKDFKFNFVKALEVAEISSKEKRDFGECANCGEPTDGDVCAVCRVKERYNRIKLSV